MKVFLFEFFFILEYSLEDSLHGILFSYIHKKKKKNVTKNYCTKLVMCCMRKKAIKYKIIRKSQFKWSSSLKINFIMFTSVFTLYSVQFSSAIYQWLVWQATSTVCIIDFIVRDILVMVFTHGGNKRAEKINIFSNKMEFCSVFSDLLV